MMTKLSAFKKGYRVELLLHYSFEPGPRPQGTVVGTSYRTVRVKMDRHGKTVGLAPSDIRIIKGKAR